MLIQYEKTITIQRCVKYFLYGGIKKINSFNATEAGYTTSPNLFNKQQHLVKNSMQQQVKFIFEQMQD